MSNIVSLIKKHPVLSGLVITALLTIGFYPTLWLGRGGIAYIMVFLWLLIMGVTGIVFIISVIALLTEKVKAERWKSLLLKTLWVLLVGGGTCGMTAIWLIAH